MDRPRSTGKGWALERLWLQAGQGFFCSVMALYGKASKLVGGLFYLFYFNVSEGQVETTNQNTYSIKRTAKSQLVPSMSTPNRSVESRVATVSI